MARQYFFTGTAAPTTPPTYAGSLFVDTSGGNIYFATGTTSSADWDPLPINLSDLTIDSDLALGGLYKIKKALGMDFQPASELTIATGAVTQTQSVHTVDTQSDAASDDLDTITIATDMSMLLVTLENAARIVTLKHGTGNLNLPDDADIVMAENTVYFLLYNGTAWNLVGSSASGGSSLPVADTTSIVEGSVDATKEMRIDVGGLTTATVRVATMPDADITLGTDADALHDNVAGEIAAITNKATPVNGDLILIEDSADGNNKKHVLASNFLAGSGDVSASANITDNAIVRGDGGSKGVQESGILIDDLDNILFPNNTAIQMDDFAGSPEDVLKLNASDVLQLSSPGSVSVLVNSSEALKLDTAGAFTVRNNVLFEGNVELNERSTPSTPGSGKCREYLSSSTGNREIKFDDGSVATIAYKGIDPQTVVAAGNDNDQTGTTYILVLTDQENTTVWMNNASANTLTIPTNASVAFAVGTKINVSMEGAGVTTISGDTGVTVNGTSGGSVVINNQYQGATLTKRASDTWIIQGDIT